MRNTTLAASLVFLFALAAYPILLDPGRKVTQLFGVEGIPNSFLYGRDGKLVAVAIDRRTQGQFLTMLKLAGLE
jgi:hypothetical protein